MLIGNGNTFVLAMFMAAGGRLRLRKAVSRRAVPVRVAVCHITVKGLPVLGSRYGKRQPDEKEF